MSKNISARLGILIGAPHRDQSSMHHDLAAMYQALKRRGLASEEILCLEGALDRRLLLELLNAIHHRVADWREGELFLYVTGHGFFSGESAQDARAGVLLQPSGREGGIPSGGNATDLALPADEQRPRLWNRPHD